MLRPKLSVITINLDNASGLLKTIESVVRQKEASYEFIVIDGASQDGSADLIQQFKHKISYSVSEKDSGIYNAMNKGLRAAQGEYLKYYKRGDQLADAQVLEKAIAWLNGPDIVYGDLILQNRQMEQTYASSPEHADPHHFMISTLPHPGSFIRKTLFEELGNYNEHYKIASDYEFFVKAILRNGASTKHIPLPIAIFDTEGISNDPQYFELMLRERKKIQAVFFSPVQLKELRQQEIKAAGRNSKFFKFVPHYASVIRLYDKFYYNWYERRLGNKGA